MKKISKSVLSVFIMVVMILTLTGCGANENSSQSSNSSSNISESKKSDSNKLVATKSEDASVMGTYKETMEITFEDGKASSILETMEFDDNEMAKYMGSIMQMTASAMDGMELSQEGNKLIVTMNPDTFSSQFNIDDDLSRDAIKKNLEKNGFTVEE